MASRACVVRAKWDDEAAVWYVSESDLPGLVAEADNVDALREKVIARVRELAELNGHLIECSKHLVVVQVNYDEALRLEPRNE